MASRSPHAAAEYVIRGEGDWREASSTAGSDARASKADRIPERRNALKKWLSKDETGKKITFAK